MQKKLLIFAVAILVLIGGAVLVWEKKTVQTQMAEEVKKTDAEPSTVNWKTYRNEQIGIQFNYPSSWGEIILSKEVGCVDYYAEKVIIPENTKDSCFHITLGASSFDSGAFLSTEGIDYTNTEIPRGVDWRYRFLSLPKNEVDFCSNNPFVPSGNRGGSLKDCESFKTATGLSVTKGVRLTPFFGSEVMTVYFIRTSHPIYYDIVVSPQYLLSASPTAEDDIRKLVESINSL